MMMAQHSPALNIVMVVLGTTIHEFAGSRTALAHRNSWMVGPSPTMTNERVASSCHVRALHTRRRA
jgi:hypothetical protein